MQAEKELARALRVAAAAAAHPELRQPMLVHGALSLVAELLQEPWRGEPSPAPSPDGAAAPTPWASLIGGGATTAAPGGGPNADAAEPDADALSLATTVDGVSGLSGAVVDAACEALGQLSLADEFGAHAAAVSGVPALLVRLLQRGAPSVRNNAARYAAARPRT